MLTSDVLLTHQANNGATSCYPGHGPSKAYIKEQKEKAACKDFCTMSTSAAKARLVLVLLVLLIYVSRELLRLTQVAAGACRDRVGRRASVCLFIYLR